MTTISRAAGLFPGRHLRRAALVPWLVGTLILAACGGGGDGDGDGAEIVVPLDLRVGVIAGLEPYAPVRHGQLLDVVSRVGQPIVLEASEPVVWSFSVNGSPLFINGTTVDFRGVTLTQVQVTRSRAELFSSFHGPALLPIEVLMTATSSIDAAEVVVVRLLLQ